MRSLASVLAQRLGAWRGLRLHVWFVASVCLIVLIHLARQLAPSQMPPFIGSAPSFLAALGLPALLLSQRQRARFARLTAAEPKVWGVGSLLASQALLLAWEFAQLHIRGMRFDLQDIIATGLGGVAWCLACLTLPPRSKSAA